MLPADSFYSSCFDPNTDSTCAQLGAFSLPSLKTGVYLDKPLSKFFVEGVLLFAIKQCHTFGFVSNSNESKFAACWSVPGTNTPTRLWGVLDFQKGTFTTNAKNNYARQGFGLLGMGAAFAARSDAFRSAWVEFLTSLNELAVKAVTDDKIAPIAQASAEGLSLMSRTKFGDGWLLDYIDSDEMYDQYLAEVENIRDLFVDTSDFLALTTAFTPMTDASTRFIGPQLDLVRRLVRRRKHTVLLGPPGVGKTVSAFEGLRLEGFEQSGIDYQLFTGHEEVKSADFLGGWQPTGEPGAFRWVYGCLPRAMMANGGRGQPILVEEFTRMPTRAQNIFISALSDGYLTLNERPSETGEGEIVRAGPDFVLLADMNVDPASDDIEMYGAAFGSRVRKIEYSYPSAAFMMQILSQEVPNISTGVRAGITATYDAVMKRYEAGELDCPISPRGCVHWAEEIVSSLEERGATDQTEDIRIAAWQGSELTWLRDVAGTNAKKRKNLMADVEAQFRKAMGTSKGKKA